MGTRRGGRESFSPARTRARIRERVRFLLPFSFSLSTSLTRVHACVRGGNGSPLSLSFSSFLLSDGPLVPATGVTTTVSKTTAAGSNTEAVEEGLTTPESAEAQASESSPEGRAGRPQRSTKPTTHPTEFVYF